MQIVMTGATGFLGGRIARRLRSRGDDVRAVVRNEYRAVALAEIGCDVVVASLHDTPALTAAMRGADALMHIAGSYEVGIRDSERPAMFDTNVGATRCVLDAAAEVALPRTVYASTIAIHGNTDGHVVSETHRRSSQREFLSCYDESKFKAHELVLERIVDDQPIIAVCPGLLYGPGDHSEVGREILQVARRRLPALMLADVGLTMVHVDDAADAFIRVLDGGRLGETYIVGGDIRRLRDVLQIAADLAGVRLTRRAVPTGLLKLLAPIASPVLPHLGYPPNLRELISVSDNVTYWADDTKIRKELGYQSRSLTDGLRQTLQAAGITTVY